LGNIDIEDELGTDAGPVELKGDPVIGRDRVGYGNPGNFKGCGGQGKQQTKADQQNLSHCYTSNFSYDREMISKYRISRFPPYTHESAKMANLLLFRNYLYSGLFCSRL
jgi:hypothetical protein